MAILHDNLPRGLCNMLPMLALFACVAVGSPAFEPSLVVAVGVSTACVAICAQHHAECIVVGSASESASSGFTFFTAVWACWRWSFSLVAALDVPEEPDIPTVMSIFYAISGPVTAISALSFWLSYGGALSAAEAAQLNAAAPIKTTSAPDLNTKTSSDSNAPTASTKRVSSPSPYSKESGDLSADVEVPLLRRDKQH